MKNNCYTVKRSTFALALLLSCVFIQAQNETKYWFFGLNAGLNFNPGSPTVVTAGQINTTEGTSAISDNSGNLLFYTDGVTVWNKNHAIMPNGTGLLGDVSTTQSALIVKKPETAKTYYIFTLPAEGTGDLHYSVVDMNLDGGNGDVTTKNTFLRTNVTEKLTAIHHCNGIDIWVIGHDLNSNAFYAFPVTNAGVGTAVVTNIGRIHKDVHGQMKISPMGLKLALTRDTVIQASPFNGIASIDVVNFNNQTGTVTQPMTINQNNWQKSYGVEFSRDESRLYVTRYDVNGLNGGNSELIQYNLTAPNPATTAVTIGTSSDPNILRALQLGPDGKIYLSKSGTPFLCVVNTPTALGTACNYTDNAIDVDPGSVGAGCMLGLPNFVQSYFHPSFPAIMTCTVETGLSRSAPERNISSVYYDALTNELKLNSALSENGNYTVKIYNAVGKLEYENSFQVNSGGNDGYHFKMPALPGGIYISKVSGPGGFAQNKFLVE
jgi:hypothetical protein